MDGNDRSRRTNRGPLIGGLAIGVVALVVVAASAWAADDFTDVPTSHPFHDEIGWMADTDISTGFADGTFRPGDPVSRQAMAAFMQRLFDLRDQVAVASSAASTTVTATSYANVVGASVTLVVPPGTTAQLLAELTGETACYGPPTPGFCEIRLLANGAEMSPTHTVGSHYAIDGNDHANESANSTEGHSIDRHHGPVGPGTYTVTVQTKVNTAGTTFVLGDWVLTGRAILQPTS